MLSNVYSLAKFRFDTAENETCYFEISSSREFEFELRTYGPVAEPWPVDLVRLTSSSESLFFFVELLQ